MTRDQSCASLGPWQQEERQEAEEPPQLRGAGAVTLLPSAGSAQSGTPYSSPLLVSCALARWGSQTPKSFTSVGSQPLSFGHLENVPCLANQVDRCFSSKILCKVAPDKL